MELIKLDSKEANERIGKKGFFRWQEENRKPGDILMEGSNNLAYGLMMYHSAMVEMDALIRQQRDVRMPKKVEQQGKANQQGEAKQQGEIKQQSEVTWKGGQEGEVVEGGSGARNRIGSSVPSTEKTLEMALDPEMYAYNIAEKYGINLRGSGQKISIKYNPNLRPGVYGRTMGANPNVIEIGPDALMSESELANTIAHELNHARDFLRGGSALEPPAYNSGNALADYINGGR